MTDVLVIGYGNTLRADDGAGPEVARRVEADALPGVEVRSLPQLTPELALDIARADRVVFVDASVDTAEVEVRRVEPGPPGPHSMSHHGDPATLLTLAGDDGRVPLSAYVVSIPATNLGLGFELSPTTAAGVDAAVNAIRELAARR